jgi:hypothetical protein
MKFGNSGRKSRRVTTFVDSLSAVYLFVAAAVQSILKRVTKRNGL